MVLILGSLLLRRLLIAVPLALTVVTVTFFLIHLAPGDPAFVLAGDAPTPEFLAQVKATYGLDGTIWQQYVAFLARAARGDFGTSIYQQRPVLDLILDRFPATLLLGGTALVVATITGTLLGVYAAKYAGTRTDTLISSLSLIGYSAPSFWIGQLLILFFAVQLGWLPVGGIASARGNFSGLAYGLDVAAHMILPAATLAIFLLTTIARFTRAAMVEMLDKDFITVAVAKGASPSRALWRHAFRNAVTTTVTMTGLEFGTVLGGAVLTEIIFSWPGLGRVFYDAVSRRDFPLLTGSLLFVSLMVIFVNALTDMTCAVLDPRLRR